MYINDYTDRAFALLASQFQPNKPDGTLSNFKKLIKAFTQSAQSVEDTILQFQDERNLTTAVGEQLDGLGQILGLSRNSGESDSSYRQRLKDQVFINVSSGTPEEMIRIIKSLTNATQVRYMDMFPAGFKLVTNGTTFPNPINSLNTALQSAAPAAVQSIPVYATFGVSKSFVFGNDSEIEPLWVTNPNPPPELDNLALNTAELLNVDPSVFTAPNFGGCFAEAIGTYPNYTYYTEGAGQFVEVIQEGGNLPMPINA